jgi:hypothetical protein
VHLSVQKIFRGYTRTPVLKGGEGRQKEGGIRRNGRKEWEGKKDGREGKERGRGREGG